MEYAKGSALHCLLHIPYLCGTMYAITPEGVFLNQIIFYLIHHTMSRLGNYLRDTATEMKHVSWPTPVQAMTYTALVIAVSAFVSLFLGASDFLFTRLLNIVIGG